MTGIRELHPPITVHREPPLNLARSDASLFSHNYVADIPSCSVHPLANTCIGPSGTRWQGIIPSQAINALSGQPLSTFKSLQAVCRELTYGSASVSSGLWVCDAWSREYFHWLADVLPKLILVDSDLPLLLPPGYLARDYIKQSLELMGIGFTELPKARARCPELQVITPVAPTGNFNPDVMTRLRNRLVAKNDDPASDRVYISREKAPRRRITNEDALRATLESFGFTCVCMEDYPWQEQISIVSRASLLMGLHGAGLTNMLFMQPGSQIIELRRQGDGHNNCYFTLASAMSHDYYYQTCPGTTDNTFDADFAVDIAELRTLLESLPH
jgi:capsular polysaccharide biosynthesis protein